MAGSRVAWAMCGLAAAAVGIGVGELTAGLIGAGSIVAAVGSLVIELQPPGGKELVVALFGTNDKLALEIGTAIGGIILGAVIGLLARRDLRLGAGALGLFGLVAFLLVQRDPLAGVGTAALTAGAAVVGSVVTLNWLSGLIARGAPSDGTAPLATRQRAPRARQAADLTRRSFIVVAGTFVAVGGVLAVIGRFLSSQIPTSGTGPSIPPPGETVAPVASASASEFAIEGLTPVVVPNDDFYRIDTELTTPRLNADDWSLTIRGMVDQEVTITYADLLAMPLVERYVTIACVSNEVGGHLVGNAKWTGTPLMPLLDRAGIQPGATQLVGRSFNGWTCGFPTEHLSGAGRDAMLVVAMNGQPLPVAHGFPARLIVPGLFGYVSATKWITEIEMTTLDAFDAYWVPRGWAKEAPILTQSRIDVPRPGQHFPAGSVQISGVAWAPTRGISKVEVLVDGESPLDAELSLPLSNASWVQWRANANVASGGHTLEVRATDGTGETQTSQRTSPVPDGARGWHLIRFVADQSESL